jgi:hypothetical protein
MNSSPHKARNYLGIINAVLRYLCTEKTAAKVAVLVEGSDDEKIYRKFFCHDITQMFVCTGKSDLQKALSGLLDKTNHAIGIRDADFCNLENIKPDGSRLFFTDGHDIEMTMLGFEETRRALFSEYGNWRNMDTAWESVVKKASFVGYIRWFNERNDCQIVFDGLFYKADCGSDKEQLLLDQLNKQSPDKKREITKELINDFITAYKTNDVFNLCNGHDVCDLLVMAFKINTKRFAESLGLSFQLNHFMQTKLCAHILAWQKTIGLDMLKTDFGAVNTQDNKQTSSSIPPARSRENPETII